MSSIKRYLQQSRNSVHENFVGADGQFADDDVYFSDEETFFNADAAAPQMSAPAPAASQSQPYIITVSNASASAVANFDVLGAFQYLQNAGFSNGNLTISGVTISSDISNVTYQEFLYQSMNNPFTVGQTMLTSVSGSSTQVLETFTLNTRDANGNQALKTLPPYIDPYQQQSGIVVMKYGYRIDGFTKVTIRNILASAVMKIYFFPSDNINIARGLGGRPVSKQFANPNVIKSSIAVVGGDTVKARLG
jgi:hypothetical protein